MSQSRRHSSPETPILKQGFLDNFEESQLFAWLAQNGKNLAYILVGLIALLVIVYRVSSGHTVQAEKDYLQAAADFTVFQKPISDNNTAAAGEALQRLNSILSKHGELHAAYDGPVAQTLMDRGQFADAKPFAQRTLERTKSDDLPIYSDFAATTLLINEKKYGQALENALMLQATISGQLEQSYAESGRFFGNALFAFNLLRIAILHQQMGNRDEELKTWQQWKQYAGLDKVPAKSAVPSQAFHTLIQQLAIGSMSLPDYIVHREKQLKGSGQ